MTKSLDLFMEKFKARSGDEQRFVDKHVIAKYEDRNGNGDDVFKAKKSKYVKRMEDRHGYDVDEDGKVYESETLDELSKSTLGRYVINARHDTESTGVALGSKLARGIPVEKGQGSKKDLDKRLWNRHKGTKLAIKKLTKEELDESSPQALAAKYKLKDIESRGVKKSQALYDKLVRKANQKVNEAKFKGYDDEDDRTDRLKIAIKKARRIARRNKAREQEQTNEESLNESVQAFKHTPGDPESEKKLALLKKLVKVHNDSTDHQKEKLRVMARGRLGKNNPNAQAHKDAGRRDPSIKHSSYHTIYVSQAPQKEYDRLDPYRRGPHSASKAIVALHKHLSEEVEDIQELSHDTLKSYVEKGDSSWNQLQKDQKKANAKAKKDPSRENNQAAVKIERKSNLRARFLNKAEKKAGIGPWQQ